MFLSTNSLSIVYTFSWEYISISSHIVVCPLFNITSVHSPERNTFNKQVWINERETELDSRWINFEVRTM